jgi:hypothetical protein
VPDAGFDLAAKAGDLPPVALDDVVEADIVFEGVRPCEVVVVLEIYIVAWEEFGG